MSRHTHGSLILIPEIKAVAFIDGVPDKCDHKWDGDNVFYTKSGKRITPLTYIKWASYTAQMREPLVHKHQEEIGDPILGGSVTCSKCKKDYFNKYDLNMM